MFFFIVKMFKEGLFLVHRYTLFDNFAYIKGVFF